MKKVYCLLFTLAFLPQTSFGALTDYNFYYINGVNNTPRNAEDSRNALRAFVLPDVSINNVQLLYQQNLGTFEAMINKARDQALLDNQRDTYKRFWACVINPNPLTCNSTNPSTPDMYQMVITTLTALDETAYVQYPRLLRMVNIVRNDYANGRKSLLIGHSQGSLYANQISNYLRTHHPEVAACTDLVSVGTPATYVARSSNSKPGRWETRDDDRIINLARTWWPWGGSILQETWIANGVADGDWTNHGFIESYLGPNAMRSRIRADIEAQTATIANSTCTLDKVPTSCGTPIVGGGSSGVKDHIMEIGQNTQTLTANFEAYSIPDELSIYANGSKIAGSGSFVGGFHSYSFTFNPQQLGTTQLLARVRGNVNPDTLWTLCIDCNGTPGSPCATSSRREVSLALSYSWESQWFCTAGQVEIDGVLWGNLTSTSPLKVLVTPTIGTEYHELVAPNAGCLCLLTLGCQTNPLATISFSYRDGNGGLHYLNAPLTKTTRFSIQ